MGVLERASKTWEHKGVKCAIVLRNLWIIEAFYCGYVQAPKWLTSKFPDYGEWPVEIHGGLTYGPDDDDFIGFDTGHGYSGYWDEDDVTNEVNRLAEQVIKLMEETK